MRLGDFSFLFFFSLLSIQVSPHPELQALKLNPCPAAKRTLNCIGGTSICLDSPGREVDRARSQELPAPDPRGKDEAVNRKTNQPSSIPIFSSTIKAPGGPGCVPIYAAYNEKK